MKTLQSEKSYGAVAVVNMISLKGRLRVADSGLRTAHYEPRVKYPQTEVKMQTADF